MMDLATRLWMLSCGLRSSGFEQRWAVHTVQNILLHVGTRENTVVSWISTLFSSSRFLRAWGVLKQRQRLGAASLFGTESL